MYISLLTTPLGDLAICANDEFVYRITFTDNEALENENDVSRQAKIELASYFSGGGQAFTFPMKQEGTAFSQEVWSQLLRVEPGKPISYQALSKRMNNPLAIRAIASANGRNNLVIAVPCHRIIGSDGSLVGFSAGLWRKKWLLEHEAKMMKMGQSVLAF